MLSAHQINQIYGIHTVLQDINFSLHTGKSPAWSARIPAA
jgi:ABC-type polar amino acid transport system ATPase subunit